MKAGWLWETSLVAEAVERFDACLMPSTALSRGYDGVAHAAIGQPARAATVETFTPCQVQLCCCSQLCTQCSAIWLRFTKWQLLWDGVMKHLPYKHKIFQNFHYFILPCIQNVIGSFILSWLYVDIAQVIHCCDWYKWSILAYHRYTCISGI